MKKYLTISFIIISFFIFFIFDLKRKETVSVLKIINANEFIVDLNSNGKIDSDETVCIGEDVFTSNLAYNQEDLIKKTGIKKIDAIKIGYLTDNFADNLLTDQKIKVKFFDKKNNNCRYADVYINNESYRNKLLDSGFVVNSSNFKKNFENAKNLELVILNHKSNKYHKLDCEYGLVAHDAIVIPKKFLLNDAIPCKFCHVDKSLIERKNYIYPTVISNGKIKLYLTDLTTQLKPDKNCSQLICKDILNLINNSKESIDMAIYGWDNVPILYNAILSAKKRGVKIRLVYDNSKKSYYPETDMLIRLADEKFGDDIKSLMHNKFIIIDKKSVITGSMNFSKTGLSGFNSNAVFVIDSSDIAKAYFDEFFQMLNGKFHDDKMRIQNKKFKLNDTEITVLFSPKDKIIVNNIVPMINNAQKYIYVPAFIVTHQDLSNALISAKQRGVDVKIIVDATNVHSTKSKIKVLKEHNIPVKTENYAGKVHSKSIIIDDKYVISGSMNFTNSGENKNDENVLIIENFKIAKYYKDFFEYLWGKIPDKYLKTYPSAESKSSVGSCSDGIDNDYDGKIDKEDEACKL